MKRILVLSALVCLTVGCQNLLNPTPSVGWSFQVGTPAVVHIPAIADMSGPQTTVTNLGTHVPQEATPAAQKMPAGQGLLPMPRTIKATQGDCLPKCDQE